MKRAMFLLAVCLISLPAVFARDMLETDALDSAAIAALLETGSVFSSEQQMLMAAGTYGNSAVDMGSYGGLLKPSQDVQEAGSQDATSKIAPTPAAPVSTASAPAATAPAAASTSSPSTVKSAALPADRSTAVLVAGVLIAASVLLL
eukprot:gene5509-5744_t